MKARLAVFTLIGVAAIAGGLRAQEPPVISIWPKAAPGETGDIGPEKTLPAKADNPATRITNISQPTLTVYRPAKEKDTGAAVIICPGGGYNYVVMDKEGSEAAQWLAKIGVTGMVLKYRTPARKEKYVPQLQDAQRAIGLVRHRAKELGIDSRKIGILGFSAGGHLAANASNNFDKRAYDAVDSADQESCRPDFALLVYPAYLARDDWKLASEINVTSKTPPTFILYAQNDRVENGLAYYAALRQAKVPTEMHLYAQGGHGFGLRPSAFAISNWPDRAETWLRGLDVLKK